MPTVIAAAAIGAGVATGVGVAVGTVATGAALGFFGQAFLTATIIGGVSKALAKKPRTPEIASSTNTAGRTVTVRQPISPWEVVIGQVRKGGVLTFRYISSDRQYWHMVITFACHTSQAIDKLYFADEEVWTPGGGVIAKYAAHVRVQVSLGDESSGTQPFPDLVSESGGRWSNDHKQYGHTKVYVRLKADPNVFPGGVPNTSVLMRGAKFYDPRSALTAYTNNAALVIAGYLTESTWGYGLAYDYTNEVHEDDLIAAANSSDEAVSLAAGGTEPRYRLNGVFAVNEQPKAILERMLAGCAGSLVDLGDSWRVNVGVYHAPTVTLSESHLAGPSVINPYIPTRDDANGVKGIFTNPNAHWQPDDFPAITSAAYLAADEGIRRWKDVDYRDFVTSITQSQRLAKIELLKLRQPLTEEGTFKLVAWGAVPGRTVARTDAQLGWSAKAFEIAESELAIVGEGDDLQLAVKHLLRETAAAIYDWSTLEEQAEDIAPNTNLPSPGTVAAPTGLAFDETDYMLTGEGELSWTASDDSFLSRYEPEYKLASAASWTPVPPVPSQATVKRFTGLPPGDYQFRVRAVNTIGVPSAYTSTLDVTLSAPALPMVSGLELFGGGLATSFGGKDAKFVWRASSQQDSYGIGSEPLGAGSGALDPYFKDYLVRIYNGDGTLRREEPLGAVTEPKYSYVYEKNVEDGDGTPARSFTFKVWNRGRQNQVSAYPAQLAVSNPQCGQPGSTTLRAEFNSLFLEWTPPADIDAEGILVHVSTSNGFAPSGTTPGVGTCRYKGSDRLVVIDNLAPATTYYVKAACYDAFGVDSLTYTAQLSVTTEQIQTVDLADLAVSTAKLAALAVTLGKLAADSVDTSKLVAAAVTEAKIAADAVTALKIAADAVTETKIAADSVTAPKIAANAVTTAKLDALAVTAEKIAAGAVVTAKLDALAVTAEKIAAGAVVTAKLDALAVTADKIAAAAVTTAKLDALAVTADKIAAGAVVTAKLAADAVTANELAVGAVTTDKLAANAVTAAKIAAGTITAAEIAAGTITAAKMATGTITAASGILADAVITTAKIDDLQVSTLKIANNAVTQPVSAYTAGDSGSFSTETSLQTVTITTTGQPVFVIGVFTALGGSSAGTVNAYVKRDSTLIATQAFATLGSGCICVAIVDQPAAGTYTYDLRCLFTNNYGGSGVAGSARDRSLFALETKK